jgi:histidyl-tRNA synthetase
MITAVRGTYDILPADAPLWQFVEARAHAVFPRYGFSELRTPLFEQTELFVRSIGDTTDIVEKEMYTFPDRKGRSLTLRPEGTAGVVRACLEHNLLTQQKLVRVYYCGAMFRYERPQAGRQRQFHQIGVEVFGSDSPLADAEVIALLVRFYEDLGLHGLTVKINTLGDSESRTRYRAALRAAVAPVRTALCGDCQRRCETNILRVLDCKVPTCRAALADLAMPRMTDTLTDAARTHYQQVLATLASLGIAYREEPTLVRGLDYYSHTIFEVAHQALGAQDALGGGGRYDGLVTDMGGPATGAVGFALGVERVLMALRAGSVSVPAAAAPVFLVAFDECAMQENLVLADRLRRAGITTVSAYDKQSPKAQMRQANNAGARIVLMRGGDERAADAYKLKDMTSGVECVCPAADVVTHVTTILAAPRE